MNTIHFKLSRVPAVRRGANCTAFAALLLFSATSAMADNHQDEMQELRDQMQQMQQRMDEKTQRQQAVGTNWSLAVTSPNDKGFMVGSQGNRI